MHSKMANITIHLFLCVRAQDLRGFTFECFFSSLLFTLFFWVFDLNGIGTNIRKDVIFPDPLSLLLSLSDAFKEDCGVFSDLPLLSASLWVFSSS